MDERFLTYYKRELQHLRDSGGEFALNHPKVASRLGLDEFECADPYVERLMEAFAFLAARVQLKIDAEFPRFIQHFLETVYPHYLSPTPSMAMVQFEADLSEGALSEGPVIPRGSVLRSEMGKGDQTRCIYKTAHDVRLWPLELVEAAYHTRDLSSLGLPEVEGARAAVRIRLRGTAGVPINELPLDDLVLHLRDVGGGEMRLYRQLLTHAIGIVVHSPARPPGWSVPLPPSAVRPVGFDDGEALLPLHPAAFHGHRLLHEYFTFPRRFMFVGLHELQAGLRRSVEDEVDITVLLAEADIELERALDESYFALSCTPAVNLFEKRLDRIHLSDRFSEFHIVPDRTAPFDYEIHSLLGVTGFGARGGSEEQAFESFYRVRDLDPRADAGYYALHRTPRQLTERERKGHRRSTSYTGSDVFVSLVDASSAPYSSDLRQLGIVARCTNRDLPLHLPVGVGRTDFTLDGGAPVQAIRCLGRPTPPRSSHADGEFAWRLINHLTPNYLSILDTEGGDAATALHDVLSLYGDATDPEVRKRIEGVVSVTSRPVVQRVGAAGPTAFARGLEVTLTMDESAFEGSGAFLLGSVLEQFFAKYVTINVFTTTVLRSVQRGEVKRWPPRIGQRPNL